MPYSRSNAIERDAWRVLAALTAGETIRFVDYEGGQYEKDVYKRAAELLPDAPIDFELLRSVNDPAQMSDSETS